MELLHGDSYKLIKDIPDKSIDLVITDPPYLFENGGEGGFENANKHKADLKELSDGFDYSIIDDYFRVLKSVNMYIWCSWKQVYPLLKYFDEKQNDFNNKLVVQMITWHKTNPIPLCDNTYLSDTEYCLFVREKGTRVYGNCQTKHKYYVTEINQKDKKLYDHPTIKPLEIIENLIINSSNEGDIILDTFMGSGTTGCACKRLNREFIGIELSDKYFETAKQRIEMTNKYNAKPKFDEKNQYSLFDNDLLLGDR